MSDLLNGGNDWTRDEWSQCGEACWMSENSGALDEWQAGLGVYID